MFLYLVNTIDKSITGVEAEDVRHITRDAYDFVKKYKPIITAAIKILQGDE